MLIRSLTSALAALAASACSLGLTSAVDAVPFDARLAEAPVSEGIWCELGEDDDGQLVVRSAEQEDDSNCVVLRWDASRRIAIATGVSDATKPPLELALADLGGGLLLIQSHEEREEGSEEPGLFVLTPGMAHGGAVTFLYLPGDERAVAQAAAYPGITFSTRHIPFMTPSLPPDAPERAEPPPSPHYYISGGPPEDIRSLSRDFLLGLMRKLVAEGNDNRDIPDHGVIAPVLVQVDRRAPDHPPTPEQRSDIDVLMKRLLALGAP